MDTTERKIILLIALGALFLLGLIFAAPALTSEEEFSGNPVEGRKIFVQKGCGSCHSVWGMGGSLGPNLAKVAGGKTRLQLAGLFWSHSPKMIAIMQQSGIPSPKFTPEEMSALMSYLYYLNYFDEPGNSAAGERVFRQKGCVKCHALGNTGGGRGSSLNKYAAQRSPIFLVQDMWDHGPKMSAAIESVRATPPKFERREMADLFAYIRSAAPEARSDRAYMVPGDPAKGRALFTSKGCLRCHAVEGSGGKIGPDLANRSFDCGVTEIASALWNHGPAMGQKMRAMGITWIQFSGNELADLLAYLYFIKFFDKPGDVATGKDLFTQKGCIRCHAAEGAGGEIGPPLAGSAALASPMHLSSAMWNHAPIMARMVSEQGMPWPKFSGDEMRDLIAYVRGLRTLSLNLKSPTDKR